MACAAGPEPGLSVSVGIDTSSKYEVPSPARARVHRVAAGRSTADGHHLVQGGVAESVTDRLLYLLARDGRSQRADGLPNEFVDAVQGLQFVALATDPFFAFLALGHVPVDADGPYRVAVLVPFDHAAVVAHPPPLAPFVCIRYSAR